MITRIIETANGIAARNPGATILPQGVYYVDSIHGLVVDYFVESGAYPPDALYVCQNDGTSYTVLITAPETFDSQNEFMGWPMVNPPDTIG
jgi:hypothetical protein